MSDQAADYFEARDYLYCLEIDFDVDAQLAAVRELLRQHRDATEAFSKDIDRLERHARQLTGISNDLAVDEWVDRLHHSIYQEAAHSMAAVGMLAPLVETIFHQCFLSIGERFFATASPRGNHPRWQTAHSIRWDCHYVLDGQQFRKDITGGILEIADAIGLATRLPADLRQVLSFLFAYRNKMFHLGFEWPMEERERFEKRISEERWCLDWVSKATTGRKPWIFYFSESFITHCLLTIDCILAGIGTFIRDDLLPPVRE